jgi:hypothetical protein
MTNQEINERVAKLCGWERKPFTYGTLDDNDQPIELQAIEWHKDGCGFRPLLKNYAESLDACREFMSQIHGVDREEFVIIARYLERVESIYEYQEQFALITLTPLELCEAFLRLKGQWE